MKTETTQPTAGDISTEEKIKNAARSIFHKKGFAATRTRDIAEEAGINLALLNYYFRSKEKLFDIIMLESLQSFIKSIKEVFNNENTSLEAKVEILVSTYIDGLTEHPDIPLFILSELRRNPDELVKKINLREVLMKSYFIKQLRQDIQEGKIAPVNPIHFIMNLLGMTVFPFVASPMLRSLSGTSQADFDELMQERKTFIPMWIKGMMKV
ncbi:MAG: TetR/AcrR family transcriptional regulator [Bacteroidetes bacterium]|nr:TetR/AcrR family transcriptional regulator [Bacteroidota bacterium]